VFFAKMSLPATRPTMRAAAPMMIDMIFGSMNVFV
jgi:hypothetical protein